MENTKKAYAAPALREVGTVSDMTKEYGFGLAELFASIVTGNPATIGKCDGGFFGCFS